jgi:hypothetical protein
MRQFMRKQLPSRLVADVKLATIEHDMIADGKGAGVNGQGGLLGTGVRMNAYLAEVVAEARFHECASADIQRLA